MSPGALYSCCPECHEQGPLQDVTLHESFEFDGVTLQALVKAAVCNRCGYHGYDQQRDIAMDAAVDEYVVKLATNLWKGRHHTPGQYRAIMSQFVFGLFREDFSNEFAQKVSDAATDAVMEIISQG